MLIRLAGGAHTQRGAQVARRPQTSHGPLETTTMTRRLRAGLGPRLVQLETTNISTTKTAMMMMMVPPMP